MKRDPNKARKSRKYLGYTFGSITLCVAAFVAMPKVIPIISGSMYKHSIKRSQTHNHDAWGPMIERKQKG